MQRDAFRKRISSTASRYRQNQQKTRASNFNGRDDYTVLASLNRKFLGCECGKEPIFLSRFPCCAASAGYLRRRQHYPGSAQPAPAATPNRLRQTHRLGHPTILRTEAEVPAVPPSCSSSAAARATGNSDSACGRRLQEALSALRPNSSLRSRKNRTIWIGLHPNG